MQNNIQKQSGMTLLEIMVVITIIGILAAMIYPSYNRYVLNARLQNAKADVTLAQNMLEKYYAQNHSFRKAGAYPVNVLSNFNNEFYHIAFYASGNCAPATLSADQYCLYAAPKSNNNGESRFVFVDETGLVQVCEKGTAGISSAGVLTNKQNAASCAS